MKKIQMKLFPLIFLSILANSANLSAQSRQTNAELRQQITIRKIANETDFVYNCTNRNDTERNVESGEVSFVNCVLRTPEESLILRTFPVISMAYKITWSPTEEGADIGIEKYDLERKKWRSVLKCKLTYLQQQNPGETFNTTFDLTISDDEPPLLEVAAVPHTLPALPAAPGGGQFAGIGPSF